MSKSDRQAVIRELIAAHEVGSQEELRKLLRQRGWDVTQSTLSRDLREMRLARVPYEGGMRYMGAAGEEAESRMVLDTLLPQLFAYVDGVGELLVLHTLRGAAQTIAEAIDEEDWPDVIGTIAGDDTILIICRSAAARERLTRRIRTLARVEG
jgi:transcriptional regulator of arginine metabolism